MCFVLQWQMHISRSFLRQDGSCVTMPPVIAASDASILRSIAFVPPTLAEKRAAATAAQGVPGIHGFKSVDAEQWLVADALNDKALKARFFSISNAMFLNERLMQVSVDCSLSSVETTVIGSSVCLLHHLQTLQVCCC
jgi:hypothetical protein